MADGVTWELVVELGDGGHEAFAALMNDAGVPEIARRPESGRYGWTSDPGTSTAHIVLGHDGPPWTAVSWAADWAIAERHLAAIQPDLARRLFAIARPVNLVRFGNGDDAPAVSDQSVSSSPAGARARPGARPRPDASRSRTDQTFSGRSVDVSLST